jgi:hypothetical protein
MKYNIYEKKVLASHSGYLRHLACKLFIEKQAGDTAWLSKATVASALAFRINGICD